MSYTFNGVVGGHHLTNPDVTSSMMTALESGAKVQVGPSEWEVFSGSVNPSGGGCFAVSGIAHMSGNFNGDLSVSGTLTPN